jgi:hypothetical protein
MSVASQNRRPFVTSHSFVGMYEPYVSDKVSVVPLLKCIFYFFHERWFLYIEIKQFIHEEKRNKKRNESGFKQISSDLKYINF